MANFLDCRSLIKSEFGTDNKLQKINMIDKTLIIS